MREFGVLSFTALLVSAALTVLFVYHWWRG